MHHNRHRPSHRGFTRSLLPLGLTAFLALVGAPRVHAAATPNPSTQAAQDKRAAFGVQARFDEDYSAMVIASVEAGSLAATSGIKAGDVIPGGLDAAGNEFEVSSAEAFGRLVGQAKFTLFVYREGVAEEEPMKIEVRRGERRSVEPEKRAAPPIEPARNTTVAGTLVLQKQSFTDPEFGGMESHTMLVPQDWSAQVQPLWTVDSGNFLHIVGRVASQDGREITFDRTRSFSYSEDQMYVQAMRQQGPAAMASFIRPPQRLGEAAVLAVTPALRPRATNVQLIEARREVELENFLKAFLEPTLAIMRQNGSEPFMSVERARVRYDEDGQSFDEISVTTVMINTLPHMLGGPPTYMWSIMGTRTFRAPTARLEGELGQLVTIANTLRPTPRWSICSAQLQQELAAIRHKGNMDRLRSMAETSRQIAKTNAEISDMQMASWKKQQAQSDASQRAFVNSINEVHDYQTRDGASISLTHDYDRVFQDPLGNVILTNDPSYDPTADTRLKTNDWKALPRIGR